MEIPLLLVVLETETTVVDGLGASPAEET